MNTYYTNPSNYRKIYENYYGPIPVDKDGRAYEIHHIDGNRNNNNISNLKAVTIQEHYDIHYSQGDRAACLLIASKMEMSPLTLSELSRKTQLKRVEQGIHPFIGGEQSRRINDIRSKNGEISKISKRTANMQVQNGTHPFQGSEKARLKK